ncbi:hypothetical protein PIB30_049848 [Stylosanthes scabra]|uniref:Uncharacterized protein n=1 Tax=Stylosanthes scabra TaxID=79078 RepID=A0ABU6ZG74_9FABA|nr:hypothetical protein [Stylosanthes scabra]
MDWSGNRPSIGPIGLALLSDRLVPLSHVDRRLIRLQDAIRLTEITGGVQSGSGRREQKERKDRNKPRRPLLEPMRTHLMRVHLGEHTLYVALLTSYVANWHKEAELGREHTLYVALLTSYVSDWRPKSNLRQQPHVIRGHCYVIHGAQEDATSDSFNSISIQVVRSQFHPLIKGLIGRLKDMID